MAETTVNDILAQIGALYVERGKLTQEITILQVKNLELEKIVSGLTEKTKEEI